MGNYDEKVENCGMLWIVFFWWLYEANKEQKMQPFLMIYIVIIW